MSGHTYRYYARRTPGDEVPSVWCGDIDGLHVYKLRNHRTMLEARVHAAWRNWRRPTPRPLADASSALPSLSAGTDETENT